MLFNASLVFSEMVDCSNAQTQLILYAVARFSNWETGECNVSADTLMGTAKCSERTLRRHLNYLAKKNIIQIEAKRDSAGHRKPPLIRLVGYADWYADQERHRVTLPPIDYYDPEPNGQNDRRPTAKERPNGQTVQANGQNDEAYGQQVAVHKDSLKGSFNKGSFNNPSESKYINTPLTTPLPPSPAATATRLNNLDEWEQAPPTPAPKVVSNRSIENPSWPESSLDQGARGEDKAAHARDVARRAAAETISTNDWARVWAEYHPEGHKAWTEWMSANGYEAQVIASRGRGYIFVPAVEFSQDGAELFSRKFPLASRAKMGNAASLIDQEMRP